MTTTGMTIESAIDEVRDAIAGLAPDERFGPIGYLMRDLKRMRDLAVRDLRVSGVPIARIARLADLSRQGVYDILNEELECVFLIDVEDGPELNSVELDRHTITADPTQIDSQDAFDLLEGWARRTGESGHLECRIFDAGGVLLGSAATNF